MQDLKIAEGYMADIYQQQHASRVISAVSRCPIVDPVLLMPSDCISSILTNQGCRYS